MSLEFLKTKTHEMRLRGKNGEWGDWWPCSSDFATRAQDQPGVEVREKAKSDESR